MQASTLHIALPWAAAPQNARAARPTVTTPPTPLQLQPTPAARDDLEARLRPLWLAAQQGDEAAYAAALRLLATRLRAWLRRRMQSHPDEIEDVVQETLLALHLQRGTWDAEVSVCAWALAIARHKLVDLWRRRGRREALNDNLDDVDESQLARTDPEPGTARDLVLLLAELPAAQQEAIRLTKLEGLSVAEASARTGASVSAIKVQVHRGLKRLALMVRAA
jgi:RNA polymerase sigma-70 factor, ECF subfamily